MGCGMFLTLALTKQVPAAGVAGNLIVEADDLLALTSSPPAAIAILDGGIQAKPFGGRLTVEFLGLTTGIHTVAVAVANGYLSDEDPDHPNQVTNLDSPYGNPHRVSVSASSWQATDFGFGPMMRACAVVRDRWTSERIGGAAVEFTARSGSIINQVYNGYPNYASYESNWFTAVDGTLPANVLLPTVKWDMKVSASGYQTLIVPGAITGGAPGDVVSLGPIYLQPIDNNGNQIADSWETRYFGSSIVIPWQDADDDGMITRDEYIAGTDPTNPLSVLAVSVSRATTTGAYARLTWPVRQGRTYSLQATDFLDNTTVWWQVTANTWEITNSQTTIQWDERCTDYWTCVYAVRVVPWDYVGSTQRVLHVYPPWGEGPGGETNGVPTP